MRTLAVVTSLRRRLENRQTIAHRNILPAIFVLFGKPTQGVGGNRSAVSLLVLDENFASQDPEKRRKNC